MPQVGPRSLDRRQSWSNEEGKEDEAKLKILVVRQFHAWFESVTTRQRTETAGSANNLEQSAAVYSLMPARSPGQKLTHVGVMNSKRMHTI